MWRLQELRSGAAVWSGAEERLPEKSAAESPGRDPVDSGEDPGTHRRR